MTGKNP